MKNSEKLPKKITEENAETTVNFLVNSVRKYTNASGIEMFDNANVVKTSGALNILSTTGVKFGFTIDLEPSTDLNRLRENVRNALAKANKVRIEYEKRDGTFESNRSWSEMTTYLKASLTGFERKNSKIGLNFDSDDIKLDDYADEAHKTGVLAIALKEQLISALRSPAETNAPTVESLIASGSDMNARVMKIFNEADVVRKVGILYTLGGPYSNGVIFGFGDKLKPAADLNEIREIVQNAVFRVDRWYRMEYEKDDVLHLVSTPPLCISIKANLSGFDRNSEIWLNFDSDPIDLDRGDKAVTTKNGVYAMALKEQVTNELKKGKIKFVKSEDIPLSF